MERIMRLRPYVSCLDFDRIKNWVTDERTHALWCAGRAEYPLSKEGFDRFLEDIAIKNGDCPYIAADDSGEPVGFFCYSVNAENNEGMLKFVIVSPERRGKGVGREMLGMALKLAFGLTGAESVRLCVFSCNDRARRCYLGAGFEERTVTDNAFRFGDERWGRCAMAIDKQRYAAASRKS